MNKTVKKNGKDDGTDGLDAMHVFWKSWEDADSLERRELVRKPARMLLSCAKAYVNHDENDKAGKDALKHAFENLLLSYFSDHGEFLRERMRVRK